VNDSPPPGWHKLVDSVAEHSLVSFILFLSALVLIGGLGFARSASEPINTDMLSLLAVEGGDAVREAGTLRVNDYGEQRQTWIVSHPGSGQAYEVAVALQADLAESGLYTVVGSASQATDSEIRSIYDAHHYQLADDKTLDLGRSGQDDALVSRVERSLFSNVMMFPADALSEDPFLTSARFFKGLFQTPPPFQIDRGFLSANVAGSWNYLVPVRLTSGAFDFEYQSRVAEFAERLIGKYQGTHQVNIQPIGVIDYAIENRKLAMYEVQLIGVLSIVMVTVLLVFTFRSVRPYVAVAFTIASGLAGGFFVCLGIFQSVHLLTLIGGSSLIGISVDYSFHLLCDSFRSAGNAEPAGGETRWRVSDGLKTVTPAIVLGLATSVLGFFGLFTSGFRGLQEIAVFSAAGLGFAFAGLIFGYPWLLAHWRPTQHVPLTLRIAKAWSGIFSGTGRGLTGLAALTIVLVVFAPEQHFDNDLRLLAAQTPEIEKLQQKSALLAGSMIASQFIVVQAESVERLLQKEEALRSVLLDLTSNGAIRHFNQVSRFVPSAKRQNETYELNRRLFLEPGTAIDALSARIGLMDEVVLARREALKTTSRPDPLALSAWLQSPTAELAQHLWLGEIDGQAASLVTLGGISNLPALQAGLRDVDGVRLVDNVADMSVVFGLYVDNALRGLAVAFVLVTGLMLWRFGLLGGLFTMLAPLLSGALTVTMLLFINEPINLFHIVGLALILGMGMDYTLFLKTNRHRSSAMLAVLMAAVTTQCAFGLLGTSAVGAIHSFGLTVALGTVISLFVAPLVAQGSIRTRSG